MLEHNVYECVRIIPENNIEWNAGFFIELNQWIVKECEFSFEIKIGA
jgi:hypothetical protein